MKNKETQAFHCFIDVSVKGFNADTSTQTFAKLLQIAQQEGIPVPEERNTEDQGKPKKAKAKSKSVTEKPVTVTEVKEFIETIIEKPVTVTEVKEFIETVPQKPVIQIVHCEKYSQDQEKPVAPVKLKSLTVEQVTELLTQDFELLRLHPAIIRAYHEIINP